MTDFVVLTRIIEKVSGQSFTDFLETKLLDRFQMTNSKFEFAAESGDRHYANVIKNRASYIDSENSPREKRKTRSF